MALTPAHSRSVRDPLAVDTRASPAARGAADVRPCWVCGAADATPWKARTLDRPLRAEDLRITDQVYGATLALDRCGRCGFIFAGRDASDALTSLYERVVDPGYERTQQPRLLQMRSLLRWARAAVPHARTLLDVGAGTGILAAEAERQGLQALGIEPSVALAAHAARLTGARVTQGTLPHPTLVGRTFDLVTLVDVIEHVADPVGLLRECARYVAPGGALLVVTPDVGSVVARVLGHRWWHFRLAHVGYFSAHTLRLAARGAGLEPRAWTRPRWYFPVEYLAERVARYLPIGPLNRLAARARPLRWLYARVIPLDLRDSQATLLGARAAAHPAPSATT